jgi:predicted GNAT family acetyltransferase
VLRAIEHDNAWLLLDRGKPVACSFFNARVPDTVQVGGVYTPPGLRGRGYGRAAVAGSLATVRLQGVRRSVLFTDKDNASAHAAYEALGYRIAGEYGIILLADAQ